MNEFTKRQLSRELEVGEEVTYISGDTYVKFAEGKMARVITEEELEEMRLI